MPPPLPPLRLLAFPANRLAGERELKWCGRMERLAVFAEITKRADLEIAVGGEPLSIWPDASDTRPLPLRGGLSGLRAQVSGSVSRVIRTRPPKAG